MNPAIQQWLMQGLRAALTTGDDSAARFDEAFWLASTSRKYFPWGEHGPPRDIVHVANALDRLQSAASNGKTIPARSLATVCRILGLVVSSLPYSEGVGHGPPFVKLHGFVRNRHTGRPFGATVLLRCTPDKSCSYGECPIERFRSGTHLRSTRCPEGKPK